MKPEIVTVGGGRHNQTLEESSSRILQGASWKRNRIVVLVPASHKIDARVYLSHCSLIFPPNNAVYRMLCLGMEVGQAYSEAIESILQHPELKDWE